MEIKTIRPCSEKRSKVIVVCSLGFPLHIERLRHYLARRKTAFKKSLFFESSNLLWLKQNEKSILVSGDGKVTVNGAESVDDALKVVKEIERAATFTEGVGV